MTPVVVPPNTRWASTKAKAPLLPVMEVTCQFLV